MDKDITITRIQDIQSFEALRADWNQLLQRTQERDIFLTWEWLFAWWKNIGQHENLLWLLLVKNKGKLVGIAPFMKNYKTKSFIKLTRLENIGNPDCDVSGLIATDIDATTNAIMEYLNKHSNEWDMLEIKELPKESKATTSLINAIKQAGHKSRKSTEEHYYIPLTEAWEQYYNKLSKNLKHNFKRRLRRAQELGKVTVNQYIGDSLTWEHFEKVFEINDKGNFTHLYKTDQIKSFHRDLFTFMRSLNWLQIEFLYINEKPIAFHYGFIYDERYEDWRGGIDKEYELIAPGKLLMMLSMEARFRMGLKENDFLRGKHSYKTDWLPSHRDFLSIQTFNKASVKSMLVYLFLKVRGR